MSTFSGLCCYSPVPVPSHSFTRPFPVLSSSCVHLALVPKISQPYLSDIKSEIIQESMLDQTNNPLTLKIATSKLYRMIFPLSRWKNMKIHSNICRRKKQKMRTLRNWKDDECRSKILKSMLAIIDILDNMDKKLN